MSVSFRFKRFEVFHDRCAMKVGTDGVLLGAWAARQMQQAGVADTVQRIADIGTGSGLIALMVAQACAQAEIVGIDIEAGAVQQAAENFQRSPWANRLQAVQTAVQDYAPAAGFDCIVSNPPYFEASMKNPDRNRTLARHTDTLSYSDLFAHARRLLRGDGVFYLILPAEQRAVLTTIAPRYGWAIDELTEVQPQPQGAVKRLLVALKQQEAHAVQSQFIVLEDVQHGRSEAYKDLTADYYL